jgi:hypothetical protein
MPQGDPASLHKVKVKLNLGFVSMDTEWTSDPRERQAAWELYVELAQELDVMRVKMWMYAGALAEIAGIKRRRE